MKRKALLFFGLSFIYLANAQIIKEFSRDTGLFVQEVMQFTGTYLESGEQPDFALFIALYDSLSYAQRLEIIDLSNLMLERKCRPRPHFITYQRVMLEFHKRQKQDHGYADWVKGYRLLLEGEESLLRNISQFLTMSLSLLKEGIFFESNSLIWKLATPSFHFKTTDRMRVHCEDVTVACYSGRDFIQILNASGTINPLELEWVGSGGTVSWERTGMPLSEMNATLASYRINLRTPGYTADSVRLYYPALFDGIAMGKLEDKVSLVKDLASIKYPQFVSYQNAYRIQDYAPGIHFQGGLSIEGAGLVGSEVGGVAPQIEIFAQDTLRVKVEAGRISMNNRFIRTKHASVSIYLGKDSIYHPDLELSFDIAQDVLRLNRTDDFKSMGPYSNSYHNMDMAFDELYWKRSDSTMRFQALQGSSVGRASFESNTFFDYGFYTDLQGMDYEHPLAQLWTYSRMLRGRTFALPNYAQYLGYSPYQVRHLLMGLSKLGFVYYDDEQDLITIRQKTFDYISAAMKQRDYDVIRFISRTEGQSNAELDIHTRDMSISGIPVIFLSDSQNVRLIPDESRIIMKRNRSFQFDGLVDAGLFQISGKNFYFDYADFLINMQQIDSLKISVITDQRNQYGEPVLSRIENAMEDMTGQLLIDHPDNKSGLASYPQYPTFTSLESAYIYFDDPSIQNGVYKRDAFYFELEPFSIDSLDNFNPNSIAPRGTFISAGILPPLDIEMTLRKDNSLGFYMESPEAGIPLYGGLGTFYEDLEMSSQGLRGYGSFAYNGSTSLSDLFMMHPDSMMARTRAFKLEEQRQGIEYPHAENEVAELRFYPETDEMQMTQLDHAFRLFQDSIYQGGQLTISGNGLRGNGVLSFPDGRLESEVFAYGSRSVSADSVGVKIKHESMEEFSLLSNDLQAFIDVDQKLGEFRSRKDFTRIELPYNLYETRLDHLTWDMEGDEVRLRQDKLLPENSVDIGIDSLKTNAPSYVSLHPGQDSLNFVATQASYDYRARLLHTRGVPFIAVADAYIFPDQRKVDIGYQASMDMLNKAKVLANQENRQHLIFDANIAVNGARDYTGSGQYNYQDAFGNAYPVLFNRIWVDTTLQSRSQGKVDADDPFMLSPWFDFQGDVYLEARKSFLNFDGGTRLVHDCSIGKDWLRFTAEVDPADIRIPVPERMQNVDLNNLYAGSLISRDSTHIYSAFLSGRKDYFDANLTQASGVLIFDPEKEQYLISTEEKLERPELPGSLLRLDTRTCEVYGEGAVNLNLDYGLVKMVSTGHASHDLKEDYFSARLILGLDFPFSEQALQLMGSELDSLPDLEPADLFSPHYLLAMKDLLGTELANTLERQVGLTGVYEEIPKAWKHTIFFNDLPLEWNQESRSFRCKGKVGIGNIGDIQVNKKVDAYIELVEKGSGDSFDIYLRANERTWYYIAYAPGGLQVLSSNADFNKMVFDLKESERRIRGAPGRPSYVYSLAANRRLQLFLERFMEYEEEIP